MSVARGLACTFGACVWSTAGAPTTWWATFCSPSGKEPVYAAAPVPATATRAATETKTKTNHRITTGAYLSALCHDLEPFTGPRPAGTGVWSTVFAHHPYLDICASWRLTPARQPLPSRITSDVPTLVLTGNYDPFINLTRIRTALAGLSHSYVVTASTMGHNVIGSPCMLTIRNGWIDAPDTAQNTNCLNNPDDGSIFTKTL